MTNLQLNISFLFCTLCLVSLGSGVPLTEGVQVVWFPDPASTNGEGLIPAHLNYPAGHITEDETDLSKAHFYLYTKDNPYIPDELFVGDADSLASSHFKLGASLKFMSHGFGGAIDHSFPWDMRGEFLNNTVDDINIVLLDWSELAESPDYVGAFTNAFAVSNLTAELIEFILDAGATTLDKVHFIGFSLGGQLVGISANRFTRRTGKIIPRITSLDPAFPLFDIAEDDDRISQDDASFVELIHTAGGTLGMVQPRGHIDFYPNGGSKQPGCGPDIFGSCSHGRAPDIFKESLFGVTPFKSCKASTWVEFNSTEFVCNETLNIGLDVDQTATGKYYLLTNEETPFALG